MSSRQVDLPRESTAGETPAPANVVGPSGEPFTAPTPNAGADVPRWRRYVAVGDSFTEGLWDLPDPSNPEVCRGWADRLAQILAQRRGGDFEYANLAIRGRLLRPIITEQVPAALRMKPDLVSLIGGGNDILRPNVDVDVLARNLEAAVIRIRQAGADVLLGTGVDASDSAVMRLTRPRVAVLNAHIWSIARRHGAYVMDEWGMNFVRDWRMWHEDRLHLTPEAHRRMAQGALAALGQRVDDPGWDEPLPTASPEAWQDRLHGNVTWMRQHAFPWVERRVRRQSSGDGRSPKIATPAPVKPADEA